MFVALAAVGTAASSSFSRLAADRLAPSTTDDLRAVLGGLNAVGFFVIGLQLVIVGSAGESGRSIRFVSGAGGRRYAAACAFLGASSGAIAGLLVQSNVGTRVGVGIQVAVTVLAMLTAVIPRSELLAAERWVPLGCLMLLGATVRLLLGALLLSGAHPQRTLLPVVIAECIAAVASYVLRPRAAFTTVRLTTRKLVIGVLASLGLLASLTFWSFGRRSRLGDETGIFNDAATLTRPIVFIPLTVAILWFPRMARHPLGTPRLRRAFLAALGWTSLLAVVTGAVIAAAPNVVARTLLGYSGVSPSVTRLLVAAWVLSAISLVPLLLYISHGSRLALVVWASAIVIVPGQLLARSANSLGVVALMSAITMFVLVAIPAVLRVQPVVHARRATTRDQVGERPHDVTVVVPCFNPGEVVITTLRSIRSELDRAGVECTIIAVSDGSSDGSDALIDQLDLPSLVHLRHPHNRGKGAALRTGFAVAESDVVAFIDADGDLAPALLPRMLAAEEHFRADIVFGSKLHPDSSVEASRLRRAYSAGYQMLIRVLFQLDVRDTQTGIKLIHRRVLDAVLPSLREDGFALDLEMFIAARAAGFTNYVEIPVVLQRQATSTTSTISTRAVRRMFGDTLRLFWRTKITLEYVRSVAQEGVSNRPGDPTEHASAPVDHAVS